MLRSLVPFSLLLASAAPLAAAGIGPEIAYTTASTNDSVYLVNPDGSGLRLLYRTPRRMRIFSLDMKPGGGELAFEEVSCCASANATLKVLSFDNSGTLVGQKSLAVCRILSIDYRPVGSQLVYNDSCGGVRLLDTAAMTSTAVAAPAGINKVVWRSADELVYNRSTAEASDILVAPLSSPSATTRVGSTVLASSMDLSTSGTRLLVDPVDYGWLSLFDMTSGADQPSWQIGHHGHFSPDDTRVLYATGYDVRGQYLMIRSTNGTGSPFRLAGKGAFGPLDWRN